MGDFLDEMLDGLGGFGLGLVNMLPGLVTGVPDIIQAQLMAQAKEGNISPMVVQMTAPMISGIYGNLLDWLTGSSDRPLMASDFLNNPTTRQLQRARLYNTTHSMLLDKSGIETMADADLEAALIAIYGKEKWETEKDSLSAKLLGGVFSQNRKNIAKTARSITYDMFDRMGINIETGEGYEPDWDFVDEDVRKYLARTRARQTSEALNDLISSAMFDARKGEDGKFKFYSRSLTQQEVSEIAAEYFRSRPDMIDRLAVNSVDDRGKFTDEDQTQFKQYLERIATGVDNMKDALGRNLTMQQAREIARGIYGFDMMSEAHSTVFQAATETIKQVMLTTGMKSEDLFGDPEKNIPGYMGKALQMYGNTGMHREVMGNLALASSIYTHGTKSNAFGISTDEFQAQVMSEMGNIEMSGLTEQAGAAYLAWARDKGLPVGKESITKFLETAKKEKINLSAITEGDYTKLGINKTDAQQYVGTQLLRETRAVVDPYLNAEIFEQQQTAAREQIRAQFIKEMGLDNPDSKEAKEISQALFNYGAREFDQWLRNNQARLGLEGKHIQNAVGAYTNANNYARHHNILWISDAQLERRKQIIRDYGSMERYASNDLTTSVLQYFKAHGEKATLADAVSVALFGHTGVIKDDSTAAKFIDGSMFAGSISKQKELEEAQAYAYNRWQQNHPGGTFAEFRQAMEEKFLDPEKLRGTGDDFAEWNKSGGNKEKDIKALKEAIRADDIVEAEKRQEGAVERLMGAVAYKADYAAPGEPLTREGEPLTREKLFQLADFATENLTTAKAKANYIRGNKRVLKEKYGWGEDDYKARLDYWDAQAEIDEKSKAPDTNKNEESTNKNTTATANNTASINSLTTVLQQIHWLLSTGMRLPIKSLAHLNNGQKGDLT